ncbi:MAG: tRNA cyclic N6-threonylcarbamoyladenosine(37) synthase TcdA [Thiohalomonas sp.]|nr:tRNA cyclic N6-threonylcarbamoyladenosine(37) synthase TcdA [Thiohalomonas sp.]
MTSHSQYSERFSGIQQLYGTHKAKIIPKLHICVIGIGGVGSWAVEALARSGIGEITLIDNDDIALSNINRQIHTLDKTINQSKVSAMQDRVLQINPECRCYAIDDLVTPNNLSKYFHQESPFDYVIDAIDSAQQKSALIYYCKRNKIPIITTGGAGGLIDPTAIEIIDLSKTYNDPLAAKVRSSLRYHYNFSRNPKRRFGIECVFSNEQQVYPQYDGSVGQKKNHIKGVTLDCNFGYGSSSCVTSVFGFAAAARAIEKAIIKAM